MLVVWARGFYIIWDILETIRKPRELHHCLYFSPKSLGDVPSFFHLSVFLCLFVMLYPGIFRYKREDLGGMGLFHLDWNQKSMISFWWSEVLVTQSCLILCHPMYCSPPGFSVLGILQARILEWAAIPFPRGSSQPRDQTKVSCIAGGFFTVGMTTEALKGSCTWKVGRHYCSILSDVFPVYIFLRIFL